MDGGRCLTSRAAVILVCVHEFVDTFVFVCHPRHLTLLSSLIPDYECRGQAIFNRGSMVFAFVVALCRITLRQSDLQVLAASP